MAEVEELPPRCKVMHYVHEFLNYFKVVLRVPPLFVIDEILKSMGSSPTIEMSLLEESEDKAILDYSVVFMAFVKFVCGSLGMCTLLFFGLRLAISLNFSFSLDNSIEI